LKIRHREPVIFSATELIVDTVFDGKTEQFRKKARGYINDSE